MHSCRHRPAAGTGQAAAAGGEQAPSSSSSTASPQQTVVLFGGFTGQQVCQEVLLLDPCTLEAKPVVSSSSSSSSSSSNSSSASGSSKAGGGGVPAARFAHTAAVISAAAGQQVRLLRARVPCSCAGLYGRGCSFCDAMHWFYGKTKHAAAQAALLKTGAAAARRHVSPLHLIQGLAPNHMTICSLLAADVAYITFV